MSLDDQIDRVRDLLAHSRRTIALTGAGISTPSGIPDFRSPNSGLWRNADPLETASIYAFRQRPQDFYHWIHPLAQLILDAEPNAAHIALAELEASGRLQAVITQNVDMLHTRAGSEVVYEVHGHLRHVTCLNCYSVYPAEPYMKTFIQTADMPFCETCGGVVKPNVILIGEQLPVKVLNEAKKLANVCDLMLVVGSSLVIAPAGDLPSIAAEAGARIVIINHEPTHLDHLADVVIHANVVDVLPMIV
jgi:NAD-dependent deacetylase